MPKISEVEAALFALAPRALAQDWDNVGLLVGDRGREVHRILVALDVTAETAEEAIQSGAELIVAHHPVMNCAWRPVQNLLEDDRQGVILRRLIRADCAAVCMHTNLDAAAGGVNDALAARLGLREVSVLENSDGIVRVGTLPAPLTLPEFLTLVRDRLSPSGIRYADVPGLISRVAVGGGACAGYWPAVRAAGCQAFVTADGKYDQFLDARSAGLALLDAGHFSTEDVICPVLVQYLQEQFPDLQVSKSTVHREAVRCFPGL